MSWFSFSWQNFWFSYLALAFEGLPFVLVGALVSGAIAAFVPSRTITRFLPKNHLLANLMSGLLGLLFPVWILVLSIYILVAAKRADVRQVI